MSTENNKSAERQIKFKTLDNNITEMLVDPDILVRDLKILVQQKLNIVPEQQRMIVQGKQMNDGKKLSEYVTQENQVIHLLKRVQDSSQPSASQVQTTQNPPNQNTTNHNTTPQNLNARPLNLDSLIGQFANNPGMVQMTSLIFDQNGNNLGANAGNLNLDLGNLLQNFGFPANNPQTSQSVNTVNSNIPATNNTTILNTNSNNNDNQNTNPNVSQTNSTQQTQQQTQSVPENRYPILNDTNRNIENMGSLVNLLNEDLRNNNIPQNPDLNYPVNILTTFGKTLENYHSNLSRLLPFINNLSNLLQRESLITESEKRQKANKLAKNILTGIRDISSANKMIEQFLTGMDFGNRPGGGMVTFIQGTINQIQLVGEAVDNLNNPHNLTLNINLDERANSNNPIYPSFPNQSNTNQNVSSSTTEANNRTANVSQNINNTSQTHNSDNANQNEEECKKQDLKEIHSNQKDSITNIQSNTTAPSESQQSQPRAGGLNNLLGNLMGNLGGAGASGQGGNPMGGLGALMGNLMRDPETSNMMSSLMGQLSQPGGANNMMNMFSNLMGGAGRGGAAGGNNLNSMLGNIMGNLNNAEDEEIEEFVMNPFVKRLVNDRTLWKKTKLDSLKRALKIKKSSQFDGFILILLDFDVEEFYSLKRLQFDGFARQSELIREKIKKLMEEKGFDIEKLKQYFVDILSENFLLVESEEDKIKSDSFELEKYSLSFISDLVDLLLNEYLSSDDFKTKIHNRLVEFLGIVFNELKKVYSSERSGALFYFADNIKNFIDKHIGEDIVDNLLEINENIFEEIISNAVDVFEQNLKNENIKKKNNENLQRNQNQEFEIKDVDHILSIADNDRQRSEKKNIVFSDEYIKTSLFKD